MRNEMGKRLKSSGHFCVQIIFPFPHVFAFLATPHFFLSFWPPSLGPLITGPGTKNIRRMDAREVEGGGTCNFSKDLLVLSRLEEEKGEKRKKENCREVAKPRCGEEGRDDSAKKRGEKGNDDLLHTADPSEYSFPEEGERGSKKGNKDQECAPISSEREGGRRPSISLSFLGTTGYNFGMPSSSSSVHKTFLSRSNLTI